MTFKELTDKIGELITTSSYSKAEIATFWEQENNEQWDEESILALGAAYEYLNKFDNRKETAAIRLSYEQRIHDLKEFYSQQ